MAHPIFTPRLTSILATPLLALGLAAAPAHAATSFTTEATISPGGLSDSQAGPPPASAVANVVDSSGRGSDIDFVGDPYAAAAGDDAGSGAVAANGLYWDGSTGDHLHATTVLTTQYTNNGTSPVSWSYDFNTGSIGPMLTIADFAGLSDTDAEAMRASFHYDLTLELSLGPPTGSGSTVYNWGYELVGGSLGHTLTQTGGDSLFSFFFDDGGGTFGYEFDPFGGGLSATADPGETVTLIATLTADVVTPGYETGAAASIGDPFLSPLQYTSTFTVVPEPLSLPLVASAALGLLGWRRRRA